MSHLPDRTAGGGEGSDREEGVVFAALDLRKSFPPGASGAEVTRWSLDKSWLFGEVVGRVWGGGRFYFFFFSFFPLSLILPPFYGFVRNI